MKKIIILLLVLFFLTLAPSFSVIKAQERETFYKAEVKNILSQGEKSQFGTLSLYQDLTLQILDGDLKGQKITLIHGESSKLAKSQLVKPGDIVFIVKILGPENTIFYQIADRYRLDRIIQLIILFFVGIIFLSGKKGIGSIIGMLVSLGVIIKYIVPQILAGHNPLVVSIIGCLIIMSTTIYLAHGFSRKTTIALIATFLTLIATGFLSVLFVEITHLTGLGSDTAASLKLGLTSNINFKGLLLGGILIGSLGVLDDVTISLAASVFELAKANPKYTFSDLFTSGLTIGKEHIASLVNTLVLAYAGASLPIFIVIVLNPNSYPLTVILNDGLIIEEVVRTLAGSIGLISAVPLTTFLAANFAKTSKINLLPSRLQNKQRK